MKKSTISLFISFMLFIAGCSKNETGAKFNCNLDEVSAQTHQQFNILFLGTNLTVENNIPRMVSKLAKSMGDSLFYLTMAPYDYDFERHATDEATLAMIRDFNWDVVVLQESGWRNALPPSMADTMSFRWADSLTLTIKENNPECRIMLFMTPGFANGVKAVDGNWAKTDPDVASYTGMQQRVKRNCVSLAEQLDAEISPCGIMWKIALDRDSTLILFINDKINPIPFTALYFIKS